jgi:hypothetical protein
MFRSTKEILFYFVLDAGAEDESVVDAEEEEEEELSAEEESSSGKAEKAFLLTESTFWSCSS